VGVEGVSTGGPDLDGAEPLSHLVMGTTNEPTNVSVEAAWCATTERLSVSWPIIDGCSIELANDSGQVVCCLIM
jgi:hypothetical protein